MHIRIEFYLEVVVSHPPLQTRAPPFPNNLIKYNHLIIDFLRMLKKLLCASLQFGFYFPMNPFK